MSKRKKSKGIKFSKEGAPQTGFQNRAKVLVECARKSGLNAKADISPYILTECLAHNLGVRLPDGDRRQRFEFLVDYLIAKFDLTMPAVKNQTFAPANRSKAFYKSWEWRHLRMDALRKHGARCQCCGATRKDIDVGGIPVRIVVDHIKPISRNWHLRLELSNLQVLCDECNMGKGARDETDWRDGQEPELTTLDQMIIDQLTPRQ